MCKAYQAVVIPEFIWVCKDLTLQEKCLLGEIGSYRECCMTNQQIAEFLNISKDRASRIISDMNKKGILEVKIYRDESTNQVVRRVLRITDEFHRKLLKD